MAFYGTLRPLNLALTPHHIFSTISRQLATNVLIHLLVPLCFFEGCPSTIKIDRSEERGGRSEKMCCLIDLVSNQERLARNIIWAFSAAFTIPEQYKGSYFWGRQMHSFHGSLIQRTIFLSQPHSHHLFQCFFFLLHPTASNQKPDLSANHVWLQHKWTSASRTAVCLGVPSSWNWDLNMLRWSFSTQSVYKGLVFTSSLYIAPLSALFYAIPILIRWKMLQRVLHNHNLTLTA